MATIPITEDQRDEGRPQKEAVPMEAYINELVQFAYNVGRALRGSARPREFIVEQVPGQQPRLVFHGTPDQVDEWEAMLYDAGYRSVKVGIPEDGGPTILHIYNEDKW